MARRADITGLGIVTCLGLQVDEIWNQVRRGACGIRRLTAIEPSVGSNADGREAAELPSDYWPQLPREARYLRWTTEEALRSAGLQNGDDGTRVAVVVGTTLHGMRSAGKYFRSRDFKHLSDFLAGDIAALALHDLLPRGIRITTCSACSSSLGAVALAQTLLEEGYADIAVAGGYDAISEYAWAGFNSLKLIADGPVRPFARHRKGMKVGEGYGMVVLERTGSSLKRGHEPMAELAGWGESADAYHLTRPSPEGAGAAAAMREAVRWAGIEPRDLDAVVAHATGTMENDAAEANALKTLLGESLASTPVTALKSHFGHTLGGAGAVELVMGVKMLVEGIVPPCANLRREDVEFEGLGVVCECEKQKPIRHLISASLGFGGTNTSVVIRHPKTTAYFADLDARRSEPVITGVGVVIPGAIGNGSFLDRMRSNVREEAPSCVISEGELENWISSRHMRRISGYVKLALCAASLAMRDAGLEEASEARARTSAIFASTHTSAAYCREYYEQIVREGAGAANPMLFAEGVPNSASAHASLMLGLKGGCQTLIGTRTAGLDALALAAMRVRTGAVERVLVVAAEEQFDLIDQAYAACQPTKPPRATRMSSCAASFLIEASETAQARGARIYTTVGMGRSVSGDRTPLRDLVNSVTNGRSVTILARPRVEMGGQSLSVEPLLALAESLLAGERGARALVAMDRRGDRVDGGVATVLMFEDWAGKTNRLGPTR